MEEGDIQLALNQNNSNFVTHEKPPGVYTIKDISEAVYTLGDNHGTLQIEYGDVSMKTKLILSPFVMLRFIKNFFFTSLRFTPYWDYKPTKTILVDNSGISTSEKILNSSIIKNSPPKLHVIDASIDNGLRGAILFGFVLDKPSGYRLFCEPVTIHYEKIDKSVLNTITFYLEDDSNKQVNFDEKTLTFTLQMIKI